MQGIMIHDHEYGMYLTVRFLGADVRGRCVSLVKEVGGIAQGFYLFPTLGRLLLDTKDICGTRA